MQDARGFHTEIIMFKMMCFVEIQVQYFVS